MSIKAFAWALRQRVGDPIAKLVLLGLAHHHNEVTNECVVLLGELVDIAGCDDGVVLHKLSDLAREGWIEILDKLPASGRRGVYRLIFLRGR